MLKSLLKLAYKARVKSPIRGLRSLNIYLIEPVNYNERSKRPTTILASRLIVSFKTSARVIAGGFSIENEDIGD